MTQLKVIHLVYGLILILISSCGENHETSFQTTEKAIDYQVENQLDNIDYDYTYQFSFQDTMFLFGYPEFDWSPFDISKGDNHLSVIDSILATNDNIYIPHDFDPYDYFHITDLNRDKKEEIIYSGPSNGEPFILLIYDFVGDQYKLVQEFEQYIHSIEFKNDSLTLNIVDPGCCASFTYLETKYKLKNWDSVNNLGNKVMLDQTLKPAKYFSNPIKFRINTTANFLRYSPEINDSIDYTPWSEGHGNKVATFFENDYGIAFAKSIDLDGREWWFVQIWPSTNFEFNILSINWTTRTSYLGWISNKYLKEI